MPKEISSPEPKNNNYTKPPSDLNHVQDSSNSQPQIKIKLERTKSILKQSSKEKNENNELQQSPKKEQITFAPECDLERRKREKEIRRIRKKIRLEKKRRSLEIDNARELLNTKRVSDSSNSSTSEKNSTRNKCENDKYLGDVKVNGDVEEKECIGGKNESIEKNICNDIRKNKDIDGDSNKFNDKSNGDKNECNGIKNECNDKKNEDNDVKKEHNDIQSGHNDIKNENDVKKELNNIKNEHNDTKNEHNDDINSEINNQKECNSLKKTLPVCKPVEKLRNSELDSETSSSTHDVTKSNLVRTKVNLGEERLEEEELKIQKVRCSPGIDLSTNPTVTFVPSNSGLEIR